MSIFCRHRSSKLSAIFYTALVPEALTEPNPAVIGQAALTGLPHLYALTPILEYLACEGMISHPPHPHRSFRKMLMDGQLAGWIVGQHICKPGKERSSLIQQHGFSNADLESCLLEFVIWHRVVAWLNLPVYLCSDDSYYDASYCFKDRWPPTFCFAEIHCALKIFMNTRALEDSDSRAKPIIECLDFIGDYLRFLSKRERQIRIHAPEPDWTRLEKLILYDELGFTSPYHESLSN